LIRGIPPLPVPETFIDFIAQHGYLFFDPLDDPCASKYAYRERELSMKFTESVSTFMHAQQPRRPTIMAWLSKRITTLRSSRILCCHSVLRRARATSCSSAAKKATACGSGNFKAMPGLRRRKFPRLSQPAACSQRSSGLGLAQRSTRRQSPQETFPNRCTDHCRMGLA
jgi:hypothetical protein